MSTEKADLPSLPPVEGLHMSALADARIIERIKVIDRHCLPIHYKELYYTNLERAAGNYNFLAYYCGLLVGSITCRLEETDTPDVFTLYVMTIGVLEPYRNLRIGSHLLQAVLNRLEKEQQYCITEVTLHVQVGSKAEDFYKKFDFEVVERVKDYYVGLDECDAFLLRKRVSCPLNQSSSQKKKKGKA